MNTESLFFETEVSITYRIKLLTSQENVIHKFIFQKFYVLIFNLVQNILRKIQKTRKGSRPRNFDIYCCLFFER